MDPFFAPPASSDNPEINSPNNNSADYWDAVWANWTSTLGNNPENDLSIFAPSSEVVSPSTQRPQETVNMMPSGNGNGPWVGIMIALSVAAAVCISSVTLLIMFRLAWLRSRRRRHGRFMEPSGVIAQIRASHSSAYSSRSASSNDNSGHQEDLESQRQAAAKLPAIVMQPDGTQVDFAVKELTQPQDKSDNLDNKSTNQATEGRQQGLEGSLEAANTPGQQQQQQQHQDLGRAGSGLTHLDSLGRYYRRGSNSGGVSSGQWRRSQGTITGAAPALITVLVEGGEEHGEEEEQARDGAEAEERAT